MPPRSAAGIAAITDLVLDFNGTLACDGALLAGVAPRLRELARQLTIHVVTGDTFGSAVAALSGLPCKVQLLQSEGQAQAKLDYVNGLGAGKVACIGNGFNDRSMMAAVALGIAVIQSEGASPATLMAADVVAPTICDALDLLLRPVRLKATLRP
jgi:soluble P-type ATPase